MLESRAVIYESHGLPSEVLRLATRQRENPRQGEVALKLLAAPINPSDLGQILGKYGKLPPLPAVAGREGVGEVMAVGPGVEGFAIGSRVRFPEMAGTWQSHAIVPANELWAVPADVPIEFAAMAWVNPPTAWRILRDAHLDTGDWVLQNAANSTVGLCVIQMAKHLGLKTLNVVRRPELEAPLREMGADVVVVEDSGYEKDVKALTGGGRVPLALNSVGGDSANRLLRALSPGGEMVTFGAMTFEKIRFPTRQLIFDDIKLTGFWLDRWYRGQPRGRVQVMFDNLFALVRQGVIKAPVARKYPLAEFAAALEAAQQPRLGKVLLVP